MVGSSGSIYGLIALHLLDLLCLCSVKSYATLSGTPRPHLQLWGWLFATLLSLLVGLLPYMDNFAHIGGLIAGFLVGFLLLPPDVFLSTRKGTKASQLDEELSKGQNCVAEAPDSVDIASFVSTNQRLFGSTSSCSYSSYSSCSLCPSPSDLPASSVIPQQSSSDFIEGRIAKKTRLSNDSMESAVRNLNILEKSKKVSAKKTSGSPSSTLPDSVHTKSSSGSDSPSLLLEMIFPLPSYTLCGKSLKQTFCLSRSLGSRVLFWYTLSKILCFLLLLLYLVGGLIVVIAFPNFASECYSCRYLSCLPVANWCSQKFGN
eukprot:TRINITY_DN7113_c0_g1_i1.p1 TRINITY_DN7113_c0_g1~~TRINITY_DN7113_c0_g1_i1.p1  ORF type:complete len:317 (+),score=25.82 TRINITY_DN7113_c0_g1_i1:174-1124(+)